MKKQKIRTIVCGVLLVCLLCIGVLPVYAASGQSSGAASSQSAQEAAYSDMQEVPQEVMQQAVSDFGEGFEAVMPWILLSLVLISAVLVLILLKTKRKFY